MSRHYIIPIFVPHFGCPHDCVFCNQKKITGLSTNVTSKEVEKIIIEHINTFKQDSFIEVAFYGGSFTAIDLEIQSQLLFIPYKFKTEGKINEIRLSTRPDAINEEILDMLKKYGVNTIELGVQSLDKDVLIASDRGHSVEDVYKSSKLIKDFGFNLGLQMMIGLPGDNMDKCLYTCKEFIKLDPFCVRIYPTLIIKDTYLEKSYLAGDYKGLSIEEAVEICTTILMLYYNANINVIRVGLQPTENIQLGKDVVAGPFHPSFRQLVESNIYKVLLDYYLLKNEITISSDELVIHCNHKLISLIAGQKKSNTNYFMKKYGFKRIRIFEKDIDPDFIFITIDKFYDKISIGSLIKSYLTQESLI